jgi:RHS repeat-associated protein
MKEVCFATSRYTGKERDSESGNDYFGARYYASPLGRWLSPDLPFSDQHLEKPQTLNLYLFAADNPLSFIDSDGRVVISPPKQVIVARESISYWKLRQVADPLGVVVAVGATAEPLNLFSGEVKQNQPNYQYNDNNDTSAAGDETGGCVLGCAGIYSKQAIGISIGLTFTYNKDKIDQASFTFQKDQSAVFVGPNPAPVKVSWGSMPGLGGAVDGPQVIGLSIDSSVLQGLTDDQLAAAELAAIKLPIGRLQTAMIAAMATEYQRRRAAAENPNGGSGPPK